MMKMELLKSIKRWFNNKKILLGLMDKNRFEELSNYSKKEWTKISISRSNPEYSQWFTIYRELEEQEKKKVDLSPYLNMKSSEILDLIRSEFCDKTNREHVYPNGIMTPKSTAISQALFELVEEKRTLETIEEYLKDTKYANKPIADVEQDPIEYEDCGCCVRSGGHWTVTLEEGSRLELDRYGTIIEEPSEGFKWLRKRR